VIWPAYFDRKLSRGDGRRIPTHSAPKNITAASIAEACRMLGWSCDTSEASYPRSWWRKSSYVVVRAGPESKSSIVRKLSEAMRRLEM